MNFLSTNQIAELWSITPRRVAVLASQGRIPGAKQLDGRWLIPENAEKPSDPRKKIVTAGSEPVERYIFPFPLSTVSSEAQLHDFSPEEADLYRLCLLYEAGHFRDARVLAERLLSSSNRYIRIGALYHLVPACVFLEDFPATEKYYLLFHTLCHDETAHKAEILLLAKEMDAEMGSGSAFLTKMDFSDQSAYSDSLAGLIGTYEMFADLVKLSATGTMPNIAAFETMCRMTEASGFFYCALVMHLYLSAIYAQTQDKEKEYCHFKAALDIGVKHGIFFSISYYLLHNAETAERVLEHYPPNVGDRVRLLANTMIHGRNAYALYHGKISTLAQLSADDYTLISCCLKKYSIDQMAETFALTRSGINKRLASLYGKLGVKSRKEMLNTFRNSVLDWE